MAPLMDAALRWLTAQTRVRRSCGWWTAQRWAAANPRSPPNARTCWATPGTAMSPLTAATTGRQAPADLYRRGHDHQVRPGHPKLVGEREAVRQLQGAQPANRPPAASAVVTDKAWRRRDRGVLRRPEAAADPPARTDEHQPPSLSQLAAPTGWRRSSGP